MAASMVNQNAPHGLGSNSEKMGAALPIDRPLFDQFKVGFMHQCGGLQSVLGSFLPHVAQSDSTQLVVNQRHKPGSGFVVSLRQL
jgi:hypothetical protein